MMLNYFFGHLCQADPKNPRHQDVQEGPTMMNDKTSEQVTQSHQSLTGHDAVLKSLQFALINKVM
jgi:hypothetical protein